MFVVSTTGATCRQELLSVCSFFFSHCVVCPSLDYGISLPLWYLQSLSYSPNNIFQMSDIHIHILMYSCIFLGNTEPVIIIITIYFPGKCRTPHNYYPIYFSGKCRITHNYYSIYFSQKYSSTHQYDSYILFLEIQSNLTLISRYILLGNTDFPIFSLNNNAFQH